MEKYGCNCGIEFKCVDCRCPCHDTPDASPFERPVDPQAEKIAGEQLRRMVSGLFR